jgi:predicted permease
MSSAKKIGNAMIPVANNAAVAQTPSTPTAVAAIVIAHLAGGGTRAIESNITDTTVAYSVK